MSVISLQYKFYKVSRHDDKSSNGWAWGKEDQLRGNTDLNRAPRLNYNCKVSNCTSSHTMMDKLNHQICIRIDTKTLPAKTKEPEANWNEWEHEK